jgi:hypothetical protein
MSTVAQEEADRFFSQKDHHPSHPEDRLDQDSNSSESSNSYNQKYSNDYHANSEKYNNDDEDTLHSMTTTKTTATYRLPTTRFNANTGPKGVISDAQSFNQAKKSTFRSTPAAFSNGTHSAFSYSSQPREVYDSNKENSLSDNSDSELGVSEEEDFVRQWRENRLKELASRGSAAQRRQSPSKRIWGTFDDVDANGYLDAIEKVPNDAIVVVCIYDPLVRRSSSTRFPRCLCTSTLCLCPKSPSLLLSPEPILSTYNASTHSAPQSNTSAAVENSLATLAQKHITTRFIKLDQEIAEMEHVIVPAILAYRTGEVFATLSGCRPDGLETVLRR